MKWQATQPDSMGIGNDALVWVVWLTIPLSCEDQYVVQHVNIQNMSSTQPYIPLLLWQHFIMS